MIAYRPTILLKLCSFIGLNYLCSALGCAHILRKASAEFHRQTIEIERWKQMSLTWKSIGEWTQVLCTAQVGLWLCMRGARGVIEESHKIWGKYGFAATMGSRCITRKSTVVTGVPYYLWFLHTTAVTALWMPRVSEAIQKTIGYRTALRQAPLPFHSTLEGIKHIFSSDTQTMPAIAFLCIPNKCSLQSPPTFDLIIMGIHEPPTAAVQCMKHRYWGTGTSQLSFILNEADCESLEHNHLYPVLSYP